MLNRRTARLGADYREMAARRFSITSVRGGRPFEGWLSRALLAASSSLRLRKYDLKREEHIPSRPEGLELGFARSRECSSGVIRSGWRRFDDAMRPQKISFGEMRDMGVRGVLVYCADFRCSRSVTTKC
jgi:hypothetical protein